MTSTLPPRQLQDHYGVLIWKFAILMHPESILESPIEITCFEFNRIRQGLVVGGCSSGQIIMWDYSKVHFEPLRNL